MGWKNLQANKPFCETKRTVAEGIPTKEIEVVSKDDSWNNDAVLLWLDTKKRTNLFKIMTAGIIQAIHDQINQEDKERLTIKRIATN